MYHQIGPGLVLLYFDTVFGKGVLVQSVSPLEPLRQRIIHQLYTSRLFIAPIAKIVLYLEALHVSTQKIIILFNISYSNKSYRFLKAEKTIKQLNLIVI